MTTSHALVVPCDTPRLPGDLVSRLLDTLGDNELVTAHDGQREQYLVFLAKSQVLGSISNFLENGTAGKTGAIYGPRGGFCLETQHFPDSPNRPTFPTTVLRPGSTYRQTTVFRFSANP